MSQKKQQRGGRCQSDIYRQANGGDYWQPSQKAGGKRPYIANMPTYQIKRKQTLTHKPVHTNPSYGWSIRSPKPGTERHVLKQRCGNRCFLKPAVEGFPICTKYSITEPYCRLDCGGILSAFRRARQYKYDKVSYAAEKLWHSKCI